MTSLKHGNPEGSTGAFMSIPSALHTAGQGRRWQVVAVAVTLLAGLALRLWLLPRGAFLHDIVQWKFWSEQLAGEPLSVFYKIATPPTDYLPGFLYVLAVVERLRRLVAGPVSLLEDFVFWAKLGPLVGDLLLGLAVFLVCRRFVSPRRALIATALVVFNPGLVFVSAVWGQADSVGCALSLMSLASLLSGSPIAAAVWGGLAFLTKPQYTAFLAVAAVAYLKAETLRLPSPNMANAASGWARWAVRRLLVPSVALVVTLQLLLLPFSVSLWPGPSVDWTLRARLAVAATKFPVTSSYAFNLWGTPIAGMELPDATPWFLSLSYQAWGFLLLAPVAMLALVVVWRRPNDVAVVLWSCFVISFGLFTLVTRMHERYLFVAIPLVAVGAVLRGWMIPYFVAVSVLYLANVMYAYTALQSRTPPLVSGIPDLGSFASILAVVLFAACLVRLLGLARASGEELGASPHDGVVPDAGHQLRNRL